MSESWRIYDSAPVECECENNKKPLNNQTEYIDVSAFPQLETPYEKAISVRSLCSHEKKLRLQTVYPQSSVYIPANRVYIRIGVEISAIMLTTNQGLQNQRSKRSIGVIGNIQVEAHDGLKRRRDRHKWAILGPSFKLYVWSLLDH